MEFVVAYTELKSVALNSVDVSRSNRNIHVLVASQNSQNREKLSSSGKIVKFGISKIKYGAISYWKWRNSASNIMKSRVSADQNNPVDK